MESVTCCVGTGAERREFSFSKKILCDKIPYFQALFNGPFLEGISQSADFPEDDPTTFGLLLGWVYTGIIETPHPKPQLHEKYAGTFQIMALYALAEKYNITSLQDQAMNYICTSSSKKGTWQYPSAMATAYGWTHERSRLRLYIIRAFVYLTLCNKMVRGSPEFNDDHLCAALLENDDLFKDFFTLLRNNGPKKPRDPRRARKSDYHQHGRNEPCPYKKT